MGKFNVYLLLFIFECTLHANIAHACKAYICENPASWHGAHANSRAHMKKFRWILVVYSTFDLSWSEKPQAAIKKLQISTNFDANCLTLKPSPLIPIQQIPSTLLAAMFFFFCMAFILNFIIRRIVSIWFHSILMAWCDHSTETVTKLSSPFRSFRSVRNELMEFKTKATHWRTLVKRCVHVRHTAHWRASWFRMVCFIDKNVDLLFIGPLAK